MNAPGAEADSPLDVERVEWVPASAETVRVRVVGRWRGAPPAVAPVLLVGELSFAADEHGVVDGAWRASFSVPIAIRSRLERRLGLRVGDAELGLPAASAGPADESLAPPPGEVVGRGVLDERRARRFEGVEGSLVRRAEAAEAEAATLRTQLENLEQRLREAGVEHDADREKIAGLRERVVAAERHASELAREMDAVRREGEEALEAAVAARREAEAAARVALEREAEAAQLVDAAGAAVGVAPARVSELEAELARREEVQSRVGAELGALRDELQRVRSEASGAGAARVAELEERERAVRTELVSREAELRTVRGELEAARSEATAREAALREALGTADELRREAAELRRRAEDERRRRFEVEAELRSELEREREELGSRLASAEGSLRAQVAAERRAFEEQAGAIEHTVAELRSRLVAVVREVEARLEAERAARAVAEAELASARSREAEVGELVRDLLTTSTGLREGFEQQLRGLEAELGARVEAERGAVRQELTAVEAELARLREQLEAERTGREAAERALEAARERGAPAKIADLERAKSRLSPASSEPSEDLHAQARAMIANLEDAERRLRQEREALEGTSRPVVRGPLGDLRPDGEDEPEPEPAAPEAPAPAPVAPEPPASAAPEPPVSAAPEPSAPAVPEPPAPVAPASPAEPAPPEPPAPAAEDDDASFALRHAAEELAAAQRAAAERAAARREARRSQRPADAGVRPGGERVKPRIVAPADRDPKPWLTTAIARLASTDRDAAARLLVQLLPAQGPAFERPLTYAIDIHGDGAFRVEIKGDGTIASLEREDVPDPLVDVRFSGPPDALAPLAGGAAPRKLSDVTTTGRWLRVRRVLRARRAPLSLEDVVEAGVALEPRLVLLAAAAALDPHWTQGHRFAVDCRIEDPAAPTETYRVHVADGATVTVDEHPPAGRPADATVILERDALTPLLARLSSPHAHDPIVRGDATVLAQLLRWTDRVQGIPERD